MDKANQILDYCNKQIKRIEKQKTKSNGLYQKVALNISKAAYEDIINGFFYNKESK